MSLNKRFKAVYSIKTLGFLLPILLTIAITLPLYFTGEQALDEITQTLTRELLLNELNRMASDINHRLERLKLIGLEDSAEHIEAIRTNALRQFAQYNYKKTGTMFVVSKTGDLPPFIVPLRS